MGCLIINEVAAEAHRRVCSVAESDVGFSSDYYGIAAVHVGMFRQSIIGVSHVEKSEVGRFAHRTTSG